MTCILDRFRRKSLIDTICRIKNREKLRLCTAQVIMPVVGIQFKELCLTSEAFKPVLSSFTSF